MQMLEDRDEAAADDEEERKPHLLASKSTKSDKALLPSWPKWAKCGPISFKFGLSSTKLVRHRPTSTKLCPAWIKISPELIKSWPVD